MTIDLISFPDYPEEVEQHVVQFVHFLRRKKYEEIIGRTRIAMVSPNRKTVIKIPVCDRGMTDNNFERSAFENHFKGKEDIPMAACRVFYANKAVGVPMLMMRFVTPAPRNAILPNWVNWIDGRQVGYDSDNKLVAYDL